MTAPRSGKPHMNAAYELPLGNYRKTFIDEAEVWVSTIVRESSAMDHRSRYFETMAFPYSPATGILWQSASGYRREADRQHDLAVRWFTRTPALSARKEHE